MISPACKRDEAFGLIGGLGWHFIYGCNDRESGGVARTV
jgi:hypothetical protein